MTHLYQFKPFYIVKGMIRPDYLDYFLLLVVIFTHSVAQVMQWMTRGR